MNARMLPPSANSFKLYKSQPESTQDTIRLHKVTRCWKDAEKMDWRTMDAVSLASNHLTPELIMS